MNNGTRIGLESLHFGLVIQVDDDNLHGNRLIKNNLVRDRPCTKDHWQHVAEDDRTKKENRIPITQRKIMTERKRFERDLTLFEQLAVRVDTIHVDTGLWSFQAEP